MVLLILHVFTRIMLLRAILNPLGKVNESDLKGNKVIVNKIVKRNERVLML
jgi:hypothetical protein